MNLTGLFLLTLAAFAVAMLVMSIGVLFRRPCLRGSCGGPDALDADGESLSCDTCPRRKQQGADLASEKE